jgi:hypothetical protein
MASFVILSWRDIPAQVIVRHGRAVAKRELPLRFQEAIDIAAMRDGAKDAEAYLAGWRRSEATPCADDIEAEADRVAREIEAAHGDGRLAELARNGGRADASGKADR